MGRVYLSGIVDPLTKPSLIPIGTMWLYEEDGTFTVPVTGTYQVEMHGGGGGAAVNYGATKYAGGGGSGEIYTVELTAGQIIDVTIGAGGASKSLTQGNANASDGGTTTFGDLSIAGGGGGLGTTSAATGGAASGSIASAGSTSTSSTGNVYGGYGNINNTAQTYGNGASASFYAYTSTITAAEPGAVIVTFKGVR